MVEVLATYVWDAMQVYHPSGEYEGPAHLASSTVEIHRNPDKQGHICVRAFDDTRPECFIVTLPVPERADTMSLSFGHRLRASDRSVPVSFGMFFREMPDDGTVLPWSGRHDAGCGEADSLHFSYLQTNYGLRYIGMEPGKNYAIAFACFPDGRVVNGDIWVMGFTVKMVRTED